MSNLSDVPCNSTKMSKPNRFKEINWRWVRWASVIHKCLKTGTWYCEFHGPLNTEHTVVVIERFVIVHYILATSILVLKHIVYIIFSFPRLRTYTFFLWTYKDQNRVRHSYSWQTGWTFLLFSPCTASTFNVLWEICGLRDGTSPQRNLSLHLPTQPKTLSIIVNHYSAPLCKWYFFCKNDSHFRSRALALSLSLFGSLLHTKRWSVVLIH